MARRILLVEDHPTMRDAMRMVLGREDRTIEEASDGRDALARIRSDPPDLVVMDLNMPGISGHDLLAALKADPATAHIRAVVVTASGEEDRDPALAAGADAYFTKPFDPTALLETVRTLLDEPATG